ncbi:Hypothetical protein LUCI_4701 [Lucifera butyrica]|uniref:histidine kinase n=1 Tax=Lucifera butyrica TaxID=1351585 RepID=A0A498RD78_9FIRM|nr:ATP-binding protein [Lucifera butyrica]VBB09411.1 Hypothetical protein LUCI_4701 [Lucifera butyrica]
MEATYLAVMIGSIIVVLAYVYLYILYRERYMGLWLLSWFIFFGRIILFDYGTFNWKQSAAGLTGFQMVIIINGLIFAWGTYVFIDKTLDKRWLYVAAGTFATGAVFTFWQYPLLYKLLPCLAFASVTCIWIGRIFTHRLQTRGIGNYVTGYALIFWGLLTLFMPYSINIPWLSPWCYLVAGIVRLIIVLGILLVYLEKTRADLVSQEYLQQANFELQQANQELNHFCHSVAHDFKAPLLSINQLASFIVRDYYDQLDRNGQELITYIQSKSAEVVNITDHLLELSRMSEKLLTMESIHLEFLFREVYDELIQIQPERNVAFKLKHLPSIYGDPIMIKILVTNILSNALKYTNKREQALIEVDSVENKNDYIISVRDNGAGFDMSESHRLFMIFERLHSVNEFEGTGIGLVVCQKILKRHHGRAWLTGKVDAGATFSFRFPKDMPKQNENTTANLSYTI